MLEEDGYEFADAPSIEDFAAQLEQSIASLDETRDDVLFDRCPADMLAYLLAREDAGEIDAGEWIERARTAMQSLDLVVFVPIEDRVAIPSHEDGEYRLVVHEKLRELLVDDALDLELDVLVVEGTVSARAAAVVHRVRAG